MGDFIHDLFLNELEILKDQNLPQYSKVVRWLRNNVQENKEGRIKSLCRNLRNIMIESWKLVEDKLDSPDSGDLFQNFISHSKPLILNSIKANYKRLFSKTQTECLLNIISLEFKTILFSRTLRIMKQLDELNVLDSSTFSESNKLLLVSTMDGKLSIVDIFYGIVILSIETGPPLFHSNLSTFSVTHNSKSIRLIPSLRGSLYRWKYNYFAEPLNVSIEELLSTNMHTSNSLFTGYKKTYISPVNQNDLSAAMKITKSIPKFIIDIHKLKLLIKRTTQNLYAHDRNTHKKLWNFSVSEIDLIPEQIEKKNSSEKPSAVHNFKINSQRGEIYRLTDYKISVTSCFWKLKLKSPIANAWVYNQNELRKIDLFASPHLHLVENNRPEYFINCHKKQKIYVRESCEFQEESSSVKTQLIDSIFDENLSNEKFVIRKKGRTKEFYVYKQNEITSENENEVEDEENVLQNVVTYNSHFESNFDFIKKLGEGGFGIVVEAIHKHDKCNYAIKRIRLNNINSMDTIQREVKVQANLKHENVVYYHNSWLEEPPLDWDDPLESEYDDDEQFSSTDYTTSYQGNISAYFYIQMQLCKGGNLYEWLDKNNSLDKRINQFESIFGQIVNGVEYIHKQNFIHRDLKPQNIFFFSENVVKIGDFGLVTNIFEPVIETPIREKYPLFKNIEHTPNVGTCLYMAPEQKKFLKYNYKVDIWSLAIIRVELLMIFKTKSERYETLEKLHKREFPQQLINKSPDECNVLSLMLKDDPKERLCTYGIRAHSPFNDNVDKCYYFDLPK